MYSAKLIGLEGSEPQRNEGDTDLPDDATTTAVIELDTLFSGVFDSDTDVDWIALDVVAGETYVIDLFSQSFTREDGTVVESSSDTFLELYDADGNFLAENDDFGEGLDSRIVFLADTTGRIFIAAGDLDGALGGYGVSVTQQDTSEDIPSNATTEAVVAAGSSFSSELDFTGDRDWIALEVEAGRTYTISLIGEDFLREDGTVAAELDDPYLYVYDADGNLIDENDDGGPGLFSELSFVATETGTIYLEAAAYQDDDTGGYTLIVEADGDVFEGDDEDNVIEGTGGDDVIFGFGGNDTLRGLGGDDILNGGSGADLLDGGEGSDTVSYADADAAVTVLLYRGFSDEGDTLVSIENVVGSVFGDVLYASREGSRLEGGGGNDRLLGFGGDDVLDGGEGDDLIIGRGGFDDINGGAGDDRILGGADSDFIQGGSGNDSIIGRGGSDLLFGGAGNDRILGGDQLDLINGGDGNDTLLGFGGSDDISGGFGHDRLFGGDGDDVLRGDRSDLTEGPIIIPDSMEDGLVAGNDTLFGGAGQDTLYGDAGDDRLFGGEDDDTIYGDSDPFDGGFPPFPGESQSMEGGETYNDTLFGDAGNDTLYGGIGNDRLFGGTGDDALFGDEGFLTVGPETPNNVQRMENGETYDDVMLGGEGNDLLVGGFGNDVMLGGDGDDVIVSDFGLDVASGGDGADLFVVGPEAGRVIVRDFEDGVDLIDLSGLNLAAETFEELGVSVNSSSSRGIILTFDAGPVIVLLGVDEADIDIDDFILDFLAEV